MANKKEDIPLLDTEDRRSTEPPIEDVPLTPIPESPAKSEETEDENKYKRRDFSKSKGKLYARMLKENYHGKNKPNEPPYGLLEDQLGDNTDGDHRRNQNAALIHYFATLSSSNSRDDIFDFQFVTSLLKNGANINTPDPSGQTIFHEVVHSWNTHIAMFLVRNGANVNKQDNYGRAPLHVAAAEDYAEMVEFLIRNGAYINIKTKQGQTPMHFAARNDAIHSIQMLLEYKASIDARDKLNRTPLQISAEKNRSKAAELLVSKGAPAAVYDVSGNSALSLLIEKIPQVALLALDQLYEADHIHRKEFYYLGYLEDPKIKNQDTPARTPLEIAVETERFDIIMHPVMHRLIRLKWDFYGKRRAIINLIFNLIYTILWTVDGVTIPKKGSELYFPIKTQSWRIAIHTTIVLFTINEIRKQIQNTILGRRSLEKWREWRHKQLQEDKSDCHPRWKQEAPYIDAEMEAVNNLSFITRADWWIYFDWIALVLILATMTSHFLFFILSTDLTKEVYHYCMMVSLLVLWFRMFNYARPFESAGPFVVIFGSVFEDVAKWGLLLLIIVIPFTCAFWITFGAFSLHPTVGYTNVGSLIYNIFSMMIIHEFNFEQLQTENPLMARILCGTFITTAGIISLNLLIALLTNTFERLYNDAVENAVMQRARTLLILQKTLRKKTRDNYYKYINTKANPLEINRRLGRILLSKPQDRVTIDKVFSDVKSIKTILKGNFGRGVRKGKHLEMEIMKDCLQKLRSLEHEARDTNMVLRMLGVRLTESTANNYSNDNNDNNDNNNNDDNNNNGDNVKSDNYSSDSTNNRGRKKADKKKDGCHEKTERDRSPKYRQKNETDFVHKPYSSNDESMQIFSPEMTRHWPNSFFHQQAGYTPQMPQTVSPGYWVHSTIPIGTGSRQRSHTGSDYSTALRHRWVPPEDNWGPIEYRPGHLEDYWEPLENRRGSQDSQWRHENNWVPQVGYAKLPRDGTEPVWDVRGSTAPHGQPGFRLYPPSHSGQSQGLKRPQQLLRRRVAVKNYYDDHMSDISDYPQSIADPDYYAEPPRGYRRKVHNRKDQSFYFENAMLFPETENYQNNAPLQNALEPKTFQTYDPEEDQRYGTLPDSGNREKDRSRSISDRRNVDILTLAVPTVREPSHLPVEDNSRNFGNHSSTTSRSQGQLPQANVSGTGGKEKEDKGMVFKATAAIAEATKQVKSFIGMKTDKETQEEKSKTSEKSEASSGELNIENTV